MVTVKKVVLSSVLVLLALSGPIQIGFLMSSTTTVSRTKLGVQLNETILDAILKCAPFSVVMEPRSACKQLVNDKIVIASGISSNHFEEVRDNYDCISALLLTKLSHRHIQPWSY